MELSAKHSCSLGTKLGSTGSACVCVCVRVCVCVCRWLRRLYGKTFYLKEKTMAIGLLTFATSPQGPEVFSALKIKPDGE